MAESINEAKAQIDSIKIKLEAQKRDDLDSSDEPQAILELEEYEEIGHLQQFKNQYRKLFEELRPVKNEIDIRQKVTDQCRQKLMAEFDQWYESSFGASTLSGEQAGAIEVIPSI